MAHKTKRVHNLHIIAQFMHTMLPARGALNKRFPINGRITLGIGQLECASDGVVCDVFYCVNNEKGFDERRQPSRVRIVQKHTSCAF